MASTVAKRPQARKQGKPSPERVLERCHGCSSAPRRVVVPPGLGLRWLVAAFASEACRRGPSFSVQGLSPRRPVADVLGDKSPIGQSGDKSQVYDRRPGRSALDTMAARITGGLTFSDANSTGNPIGKACRGQNGERRPRNGAPVRQTPPPTGTRRNPGEAVGRSNQSVTHDRNRRVENPTQNSHPTPPSLPASSQLILLMASAAPGRNAGRNGSNPDR